MILKSLELHNYRRYKDVAIEFPSGLLGIVGKNGTGKSTLIESIGWCLYGNHASRTDKEGIRRTSCAPTEDCKVILEMMLGDDSVRVERELRGRNFQDYARLFLNSDTSPHVNGATDVSDYIMRRTGLDRVAFFISVFARQKELSALSDLQPAKRKETILRLLRIDKIETAITNVRSDIRQSQDRIYYIKSTLKDIDQLLREGQTLDQERIDKTSEIESTDKEIISLEKSVKKATKEFEIQEKKYQQHNKFSSNIGKLEERRKGKNSQRSRDASDLTAAQGSEDEFKKLKPAIVEFENIQREKDSLDKIAPKFKTKIALEYRRTEIDSKISEYLKSKTEISRRLFEYKKLDAAFKVNRKIISSEEQKRKKTEAILNQLKTRIKSLSSDKRKIQTEFSKIKGLGKKGSCPTCKRILGNHLPIISQHYEQEIKRIDGSISMLDKSKQQSENKLETILSNTERLGREEEKLRKGMTERTKLQTRLKGIVGNLADEKKNLNKATNQLKKFVSVSYDEARHEKVRAEFSRLSKINAKCIGLKRDIQRIPKLQKSITSLKSAIEKLDSSIETEKIRLVNVGFEQSEYDKTKKALTDVREEYRNKRELAIKQKADLQQIETKITQNNLTVEEEKQKRVTVEAEEKTIGSRSKLEKILADFKIDLISRIRPILASRATDLFRQITNGRYANMDLDEDYNIRIEDEGEVFGVERFSGGEEDLANLCLRIAISQELSERAGGVRTNFIALDEIFGSQDADRKGNILKALTELSNQFRQIILITHIEDIKESLPYVLHIQDGSNGIVKIESEGISPVAPVSL